MGLSNISFEALPSGVGVFQLEGTKNFLEELFFLFKTGSSITQAGLKFIM